MARLGSFGTLPSGSGSPAELRLAHQPAQRTDLVLGLLQGPGWMSDGAEELVPWFLRYPVVKDIEFTNHRSICTVLHSASTNLDWPGSAAQGLLRLSGTHLRQCWRSMRSTVGTVGALQNRQNSAAIVKFPCPDCAKSGQNFSSKICPLRTFGRHERVGKRAQVACFQCFIWLWGREEEWSR